MRPQPAAPSVHSAPLPPPGSVAYHRLGLTHRFSRYSWWRPLLELVLVVVIGLLFLAAFSVFTAFMLTMTAYVPSGTKLDELDPADPAAKLFLYGALGVLLPVPFIAALIMGRHPRALWSVANRFRWSMFWLAFAVAGGYNAAMILLDAFAAGGFTGPNPEIYNEDFLVSIVVVVVFVPLQATAEEVVFRGSVVQALGSWCRSPWVAYLLGIPLFVIGHDYDPAGLFLVGIFATVCCFFVHITGGLEVAVALHIINNLAVEYQKAAGLFDVELLDRPSIILMSELSNYVLVGILLLVFRKHSPRRRYLQQLPPPAMQHAPPASQHVPPAVQPLPPQQLPAPIQPPLPRPVQQFPRPPQGPGTPIQHHPKPDHRYPHNPGGPSR